LLTCTGLVTTPPPPVLCRMVLRVIKLLPLPLGKVCPLLIIDFLGGLTYPHPCKRTSYMNIVWGVLGAVNHSYPFFLLLIICNLKYKILISYGPILEKKKLSIYRITYSYKISCRFFFFFCHH
jgi:hypothetical protein